MIDEVREALRGVARLYSGEDRLAAAAISSYLLPF